MLTFEFITEKISGMTSCEKITNKSFVMKKVFKIGVKPIVESGKTYVGIATFKGNGLLFKQACELTTNNLKRCYIIDTENNDILDILDAYIQQEFRKKLDVY